MNHNSTAVGRVIGLDSHPDSFTAAVLRGETPAQAIVEKSFHKVPMAHLPSWARKHTSSEDLLVLEASGNSFQVVRALKAIGRQALVLESRQLGKLKEAHANNDKRSAVRIAKAYLAGTAREVWVPDEKTQQRRDWFHVHRKATKRTTQMRARLSSYLSDNGVRLKKGTSLIQERVVEAQLRKQKEWSPRQWQVIAGMLMELRHAEEQRKHWRSLIAQEVIADPMLLSLVRLCGVRDVVAFALGAIIGDIGRFASPAKLVRYVGLDPALDESGQSRWEGGVGRHGRKDLRALLIEASQAIYRSRDALAKWGRKLFARKSSLNLVVAAIARKLTVAIWYLLMGRFTALEELDSRLKIKTGKILSAVGKSAMKQIGKSRKKLREEIEHSLKTSRIYVLDLNKNFLPKQTLAARCI